MAERPEYVPVFIESATDIKEFLLANIPDTWRKEVGDFPYDMIIPDVAQVMQLEITADRILQNAFPQYCEDERMNDHMNVRGLNRIEATANKRLLSIVADPGVRIPKGYTFTSVVVDEDGNPIEFTADSETIFLSEDAVDVRVTCKLTGEIGNLGAGSEFILQPPIAGVTSITDKGTVVAAAERESPGEAWERIKDKAENPDTGGNVNDYKRWVIDGFYKESGVKIGKVLVDMCWDKDNGHDGRGTVRVVCVGDDYEPLDGSIIKDIKEYLDPVDQEGYGYGKAPGGAVVTVITGTPLPINISASIVYERNVDRAQVLQQFKDKATEYIQSRVFNRDEETKKLSPIAYKKIGGILSTLSGVANYDDLTVNGGTTDIEVEPYEIPGLGEVTFT
ncbi:baseplate J/gp47 family protein [Blautia sp.]|uniref:baseplate J/gp47 family protein n=1 Tax=Blautia sp. TaxID=1955243 RepID=UPI00258BEF23|nr:baseplate J/gp47 family protein [Blautia sp.]